MLTSRYTSSCLAWSLPVLLCPALIAFSALPKTNDAYGSRERNPSCYVCQEEDDSDHTVNISSFMLFGTARPPSSNMADWMYWTVFFCLCVWMWIFTASVCKCNVCFFRCSVFSCLFSVFGVLFVTVSGLSHNYGTYAKKYLHIVFISPPFGTFNLFNGNKQNWKANVRWFVWNFPQMQEEYCLRTF